MTKNGGFTEPIHDPFLEKQKRKWREFEASQEQQQPAAKKKSNGHIPLTMEKRQQTLDIGALFRTNPKKDDVSKPERNFNKAAGAANYGKTLQKTRPQSNPSAKIMEAKSVELEGFRMANGSKEHIKEVKSITPFFQKKRSSIEIVIGDDMPSTSKQEKKSENSAEQKLTEKAKAVDLNDLKTWPELQHIEGHIVDHIQREILNLNNNVTWDSLAGLEPAKEALHEIIVLPFKRNDLFTGLRAPSKGVLLFGPPGTGKTMIARCVANHAKATFFNVSVSTMTSKWVGEGEKMVRALFEIARLKLPAIIFIDEIDALLSARNTGEHESSRRMKTEFLTQMDGISTSADERLLVLGATNKPEEIDEAARRRFPKKLYIPLPEGLARRRMIEMFLGTVKTDLSDADYTKLAELTKGFSGADMYNLAKEAAFCPIREVIDEIETIPKENIRPIVLTDFERMLPKVKPTVLESELQSYQEWNNQFGCTR